MNDHKGFIAVFRRECKRIATSKIYIWGAIIAPLLSAVILLYLMNLGMPHKIPIAVVDLDNTASTRILIRQLDAFAKTDIKYKDLSLKEARERMQKLEIYAILYIPKDFTRDAQAGYPPLITYYTNSSFMVAGSLLFQELKTISTLASASITKQLMVAGGKDIEEIMPVASPIKMESHPIHNPWLHYSVLLNNIVLPCILQLIILIFTISGFASEIKARNGENLVALSGNSSWSLAMGKLLPNTIIFTIISLLYISLLYYYNNFPLHNGFLPIFVAYILLIMASQSLGLFIFCIFKNYRFAVSVAGLVGIICFSLVGFSYPSYSLYPELQSLAYIYPVKHFYIIYGDQALNGAPLIYSFKYYLILMAYILAGMMLFGSVKKIVQHDEYEL